MRGEHPDGAAACLAANGGTHDIGDRQIWPVFGNDWAAPREGRTRRPPTEWRAGVVVHRVAVSCPKGHHRREGGPLTFSDCALSRDPDGLQIIVAE